jgi:DNA-binding transcriptional LysR family regulator
VDLGLVEGEGPASGLTRGPFAEDELVVIAAPDSRLAARERLSQSDLAGAILPAREAGSGKRQMVEAALARAWVRVAVVWSRGAPRRSGAVVTDLSISVLSRSAV